MKSQIEKVKLFDEETLLSEKGKSLSPLAWNRIAEKLNELIDYLEPEKEENRAKTDENYDSFIRGGLHVGFTDDQVDFLENWILNTVPTNPKESSEKPFEKKCCEKCTCKCKGAVTAHYGCDNTICPCHTPVETEWKKEFKKKFVNSLEVERGENMIEFISSLLTTTRQKAYEEGLNERTIQLEQARAEEKERVKGIIEKKIVFLTRIRMSTQGSENIAKIDGGCDTLSDILTKIDNLK